MNESSDRDPPERPLTADEVYDVQSHVLYRVESPLKLWILRALGELYDIKRRAPRRDGDNQP